MVDYREIIGLKSLKFSNLAIANSLYCSRNTVSEVLSLAETPAYVFAAVLPCSLYGYAEAFPDMKSNHWIEVHVYAYSFFGGVMRMLVPGNLKTGMIKNTRTELALNRSYHEMAEHYGTAIIPARPVKPKGKPNAKGAVKALETWILAALRNHKFFSFEDLNKAIHEKLEEFNAKPFQKKKGSRLSAFMEQNGWKTPVPRHSVIRQAQVLKTSVPFLKMVRIKWL